MKIDLSVRTSGVGSLSGRVCLLLRQHFNLFNILALPLTVAALLLPVTEAAAQTVLIDTGQGGTSSIGANSLFSTGGACSPAPTCSSNFQLIAAQFTLTQATTLDSVQIWAGPFGSGGSLAVRIRSVNPNKNGLPGETQPPYLGPTSIYERTYPLGSTGGSAGWVTFPNYNAILAAGTYWLCLEPVPGSGLNYNMPGGAANPLAKYAFFGNGNPGYLALLPNPGMGIRVLGTNFPGYAFGTATRTILTVDPLRDITRGGDGQALTYQWIIDLNGSGTSFGVGRLNANGTQNDLNGLSAGAYAVTCWSRYFSSCASSAGRGVAYRSFINAGAVARTFRVNAALDGAFYGIGGARATAGIYAFNTAGFTNTLTNSGVGAAEYLLRRDSLSELRAGDSTLSLATLFPGSLLATAFVSPAFPAGQVQTTNLSTGFITLNPQETFTLMFDVTAFSENGGSANFSDTLAPAANFFTDTAGNPVTDILAVGPPSIPSAAPAALVLSPATATNPVGSPYRVTATATDSTGAPVPNATVAFKITSGPNTGQPGSFVTDANGQVTFDYTSSIDGTDSIQASIKTLQSNTVQTTWTVPGELDHIVISPSTATIAAGIGQLYTVVAFDKFNNTRGDVTAGTTFSIAPDGSCAGASCTATLAGPHTVTGTYNAKTAQATLTVTAAQVTPVITWPAPAAITYGTPLSTAQLNATANTAGTFVYTPAAGTVLNAGTQQLSVVFNPTDTTNYTTASAHVSLQIDKVTPVITWPAPPAITYGTPLSAAQLNATANTAGTFVYTPAAGTVLNAGTRQLSVVFNPTDATNYTTASAHVSLQINKAAPVITWPAPAAITSGTPLGAAQLNATANTAGTFVYTPAAGTVLNAGTQQLSVVFTPTDTTNYTNAGAQVSLVVNPSGKTTPIITWPAPAPITYGTPLNATQLNATANVPGAFAYNPRALTILDAGTQILTVTFTPSDTSLYNNATASVTLRVNPAKPQVLWAPVPIVYGTPLGPLQLTALTVVPGRFTYTPAAGAILPAGERKLTAIFTPNNTTNFQTINVEATLLVFKASPTVSWVQPTPITAGTPLSAAQLNATANVPGTFVYSPAVGTKLNSGTWALTTTFTPADSANYRTVSAVVLLTVRPR